MSSLRVIITAIRLVKLVFLIGLLGVLSGFALLHTHGGREWLTGKIHAVAGDHVRITGLSGMIPVRINLERLEILDRTGTVWLSADDVYARLSTRALIRGRLLLRVVRAGQLDWHAMPVYDAGDGASPDEGDHHTSFHGLTAERVMADHFTINPGITGIALSGQLEGSLRWLARKGELRAKATTDLLIDEILAISASAGLLYQDNHLIITDGVATREDAQLAASAHFDFDQGRYEISGTFTGTSWTPYSAWTGVSIDGDFRGDWNILRDGSGGPWLFVIKAASTQTTHGAITLNDARIDTTITWQPSSQGGGLQIAVASGQTRWNGHTITVCEPAGFSFRENDASIELPCLSIDGSTLQARLNLKDQRVDEVEAQADVIDLSVIPLSSGLPGLNGHATAKLHLKNLTHEPSGKLEISAQGIHFPLGPLRHFSEAQLALAAHLDHQKLTASATITHPLLDLFTLEAAAKLIPSENAIPLAVDRERGVDVRLLLNGNLKELTDTLLDAPMGFSGALTADLSIGNLPHAPDFSGTIAWRDGQFRNITTETFLDRINVVFRGDGQRLVVKEGSARDGGAGSITAGGAIYPGPDWRPAWTGHLDIVKATLFRFVRTELPLSGQITTSGDAHQARIAGDLMLEPFRFNIPRRLPPSVRTLDVVEINHPDPTRNTRIADEAPPAKGLAKDSRPIDFNIRVATRRGERFEVNGRGLRSEWAGSMRLAGNSDNPILTGAAEVKRGYAMLLGRRFTIDEGRIELTGSVPPRPQLNIAASTRVGDILARLVVSGSTDQPVIRLTSDPLLPEDEVMAMVLFGKLVDTMTPWQAIAMANGLRLLSGQESDIAGVLDASQNLLRVDQIEIRQDEEGEGLASIAVGKHVGRNLYVEGEKGFGEAEDVISIKLDLTPNIVLETETSPRIREGIGLYWRKDL